MLIIVFFRPIMKTITYYLEYLATRFLTAIAARLPLSLARKTGRGLGCFFFDVVKIRRCHTINNLTHAFPQKSTVEIENLGRRTYENIGMSMFEYLHLVATGKDGFSKLVHVHNAVLLDTALRAGKGAILLTAHFGGWETAAAWLSINGYPVTFMYKKPKNPYIDRLVLQKRQSCGMKMVERSLGIRTYLQALRAGEFTCLLADQDGGRKGIFLDFMARPASTPVGPAVFAHKTGAPIIFFILHRDEQNNLHLHFEQLDYNIDNLEKADAVRTVATAYTRHLESWIRTYPDQWFWMHRRWMTKEKKQKP